MIIEGGTNAIQTVLVNLNDTPPVPVVVCDGSGRAADLISYAHKYIYVNPNTKIGYLFYFFNWNIISQLILKLKSSINLKSKDQLLSNIMNQFDYSIIQAEHMFEQLKNCVLNKDLVFLFAYKSNLVINYRRLFVLSRYVFTEWA